LRLQARAAPHSSLRRHSASTPSAYFVVRDESSAYAQEPQRAFGLHEGEVGAARVVFLRARIGAAIEFTPRDGLHAYL